MEFREKTHTNKYKGLRTTRIMSPAVRLCHLYVGSGMGLRKFPQLDFCFRQQTALLPVSWLLTPSFETVSTVRLQLWNHLLNYSFCAHRESFRGSCLSTWFVELNLLTPYTRVLLEDLSSDDHIPPHFMEPEGSLSCSQKPATGPYPKPDKSGLRTSILFC
jgi:hypothetical protein